MSLDDPLPCAECSGPLAPRRTAHGLVWICHACVGGAANLGVIRKVAPRPFVNHLWQAALRFGRECELACPSCFRPLLRFDPAEVELSLSLRLCCRCLLIWLDRPALAALKLEDRGPSPAREAAARLESEAFAEADAAWREAPEATTLALAAVAGVAQVLETALGEGGG